MSSNEFFGKNGLVSFTGVVEDRNDPLKLGRVRVRIFGWHTSNKQEMPTESLNWSRVLCPLDNGKNPYTPKESDYVFGFFLDEDKQESLIIGSFHGIPEEASNPEEGFNDPRTNLEEIPLPPQYDSVDLENVENEDSNQEENTGRFYNEDATPGSTTSFGVLKKFYDPSNYKFDINNDGKYDSVDASLLRDPNQDGEFGLFDGGESLVSEIEALPKSNYPLPDELREPTTSRLARNENIQKTIVAIKKSGITSGETASHQASGIGSDTESSETEGFAEPETLYDAKYPYNHVYESESGHVIEIDDTPGAERIHHYHRSGSFTEYHPTADIVSKSKNNYYTIATGDNNNYAGKTYNISAEELLNMIGKTVNLNSRESMNIKSGSGMTQTVGSSLTTQVSENQYTIVSGDKFELIKGDYNIIVKGDLKIKVDGNILVDSAQLIKHQAPLIVSDAKMINSILGGQSISLTGELMGDNIKAHTAGGIGDPPLPPIPIVVEAENDADEEAIPETTSPKEGFILDGPDGYLYKPTSDSSGKLVTLSPEVASHTLWEAVPTGELETVTIQYKHADNTITSWEVVRPVHKKGRLIEVGKFKAIANGNRAHYTWKKAGADYPSQMFWQIGGKEPFFILDSAVRHD